MVDWHKAKSLCGSSKFREILHMLNESLNKTDTNIHYTWYFNSRNIVLSTDWIPFNLWVGTLKNNIKQFKPETLKTWIRSLMPCNTMKQTCLKCVSCLHTITYHIEGCTCCAPSPIYIRIHISYVDINKNDNLPFWNPAKKPSAPFALPATAYSRKAQLRCGQHERSLLI